MRIAHLLLPNSLSKGFDYLVPEGMDVTPGSYVFSSFAGRSLRAVVWGKGKGEVPEAKLKPITEHYAHLPPMEASMRAFLDWVGWYTLSPMGAVVKMAVPVADALKPPSARERNMLEATTLNPACAVLSPAQAEAAAALKALQGFSVTLLDGVTGSGKTEVYFDAIAKIISTPLPFTGRAGGGNPPPPSYAAPAVSPLNPPTSGGNEALAHEFGQVLVLLPEISLSVQWLERFFSRFGAEPHVWHSGLTPARRKHSWRAIVNGEAKVVVGARSALFLPFRNLKLIVVDEEHDSSYKQEDGVIYHARDMAVARGRHENIPVLLVSATPSIESMWNVDQGKYARIRLNERHAGASFPATRLIDLRHAQLERNTFLSAELRRALAENVSRGEQSMLFLNRRGYAPLLLCRACGHRFQCTECSSWLVMHQYPPRLECHHCGFAKPMPKRCPSCQAEDAFHAVGPGVERVAEEVGSFLPDAKTALLTSDAAENYEELQSAIRAMQEGKTDILIGTQIIAKGHHFPKLTLVGVVDADLGLAGGDLRAAERTYQLLHQLAGRAGRERGMEGEVLIQSFLPDHPVMQALLSGDRDAFMALELESRRMAGMPPFSRLVALIVEGAHEDTVIRHARDLALAAPRIEGVEILGPAPAPLYLLRGHYRYRLLVRAERNIHIQKTVSEWLGSLKHPNSLRIKVDIDPYGFL